MDQLQPAPIEPQDPAQVVQRALAMRVEAVNLANQRREPEALKILQEAERLCRENGQESTLAYILHEKAITLSTGGDPAAALEVIEEAEQIYYALSDWKQLYMVARSKAVFWGELHDQEHSRQAWDEADKIVTDWLQQARQGDDPANLVDALLLYAMRPRAATDRTERTRCFDEALEVATRHQLSDRIQEIHKLNALFSLAGTGRDRQTSTPSDRRLLWTIVVVAVIFALIAVLPIVLRGCS